jgi:hypothetical protein
MKRSHGIPALVIALGVVVAGCGGQPFPTTAPRTSTGGSTPRAQLLAAVKRTNAAKTAHFSVDMSMSGLGGAGDVKVTGSGAMDLTRKRFSMKLSGTGPAAMSNMTMEMRLIGSTAYFNGGHGWTSQAVSTAGAFTPVPTSYLDFLKGLGSTVRVVGREKVRGDDTTRYRANIDFARAAARVGSASERAAVKPMLDLLGLTKIPVSVWVDDLGRLRKFSMTMDFSALGDQLGGATAGVKPKMTLAMEMYDFGVPVSVQVPSGAVPSTSKSGTSFCLEASCSGSGVAPTAHDIQSDLRNALTTEKVTYTDNMAYTSDVATLKQIEPSLDWGGRMKVTIGDSSVATDGVVCLSETANGLTYSLGDVSSGPGVGTYYGTAPCPKNLTPASFSTFDSSW